MIFSRPKSTALLIFVIVLIILLLNNKYHIDAKIKINGDFSQPIFLNYFWDSGSGYNKYEENNVWLGRYVNFKYQSHSVEIGFISDGSEKRKKIWINNIFIKAGASESEYIGTLEKKIEIKSCKPLKMNLKFSKIMFSFKNGTTKLGIFIKIDDQIYKLLSPESEMISIIRLKKFIPGNATNVIPLPRLKLYGLKFQIVDRDSNFKINDLKCLPNISVSEKSLSRLRNLNNEVRFKGKYLPNTKFHPLLFAIQVFLSYIIAWLFYELIISIKKLDCPNLIAILKRIFIEDKRWIFWVIFINTFLFLLFWLLGQWPGDMLWDTFTIWGQAQSLNLDNNHSFIYILINSLLFQFYNSPAVIAIFQIILMSGLTAWIFFFAYRNNANTKLLFLFYILLITSIPIGMSTILVSTTTLFALLTLFWGFYLFRLGFYKKIGKQIIFSNKNLFVLAFIFYLLISMRHNGLIYILFLPLTVLLLKGFSKRNFIGFIIYFIIIFLTFNYGVGTILKIHEKTNYNFFKLSYKIPTIIYFFANKNMYYSDQFKKELEILEKVENVDILTKDFHIKHFSRYFSKLKKKLIKNEKEISDLFYKSVSNNIPLYLSYRVHLFSANLGLSNYGWLYYLDGKDIEKIKRTRSLTQRKLINKAVIPCLEQLQGKILKTTSDFTHFYKFKFW
ncbi:MAG: hypothetical protein ACFFG0_22940, partial [Candidatus Thorarchaeota archaeon]